ncbi:MAG: zinc ABC transporter ATP-binding protein ZnuC [Alphaproteobacteria bacterium]|nr:zinc ABC transporter ATP-binding protein ZnuC [Alphaproteobacteria bacterium]
MTIPPPTDPDFLVRAEAIDVRIAGRTVITQVSVAVRAGEIVTVIGPNGAGKTVLVRTLLGLLRPVTGRIDRRSGLRIGYAPQRLHIDPVLPLSVSRFLALAGPTGRARIEAALAETGAAGVVDAPIQSISGGEFQRVLLARALMRDPDLLVLDEPVQGVDIGGQTNLYRLIAELRDRRGCGVLLVSHDLHLVMASTDRVVCLNRHVCCTGHPDAVAQDPAYIELFGPEAARQVAIYVHDHDHDHDAAGNIVGQRRAPPSDAAHHDHG